MGIGGTGTGFFPNRKNEKFIKDMKECMISLIRNNCNTHHLCKYVLLLKSKKSIDDCYSVSDDKIIEKDLINSIGDIYMYQLYVDEFIVTSFKFGNLSKKYNQVIKKILS